MKRSRTVAALSAVAFVSGCGSLSAPGPGASPSGASQTGAAPITFPTPPLPATRALPSTGGESPADGKLDRNPAGPGGACDGDPWRYGDDATPSPGATPVRAREPLPADFVPVLLITCGLEERIRADGEWTYRVELRATEQLDAVVAALRALLAPKRDGNYGCTMELPAEPWFVLQDAGGRQVIPPIPHDNSCHKPINVGLLGLDYTRTKLTPFRQQSTAAQIDTHCVAAWKNIPRIVAKDGTLKPLGPLPALRPVNVCVFGATLDDPDAGTFVGGATLTDSEATRLGSALAAIDGAGSAACASTDDFALVFAAGDPLYVELSGCHRVFGGNGDQASVPAPQVAAVIKELKLQH